MAGSQRTDVPESRKRELAAYFRNPDWVAGKVPCVVTGDPLDEDEDSTWHHLNHRPNDHRLSNIVPLCQRLNKNLDVGRRDRNALNGLLECDALRNKADTAFWVYGQVAQAYGCTRIEYYVGQYCGRSLSHRLDCARRALYYGRHKLDYALIDELVSTTVLRLLRAPSQRVCPVVLRDLLQEFEALLTVGGEVREAFHLQELGTSKQVVRNPTKQAAALRRSAHTLGMIHGPRKDVIEELAASATVISFFDANQCLNVANTKIDLFIGEHTRAHYQRALDVASETYEQLIAPKIDFHHGIVWPRLKPQTLPIRATPANIADLCLMHAVLLAVNRAAEWKRRSQEAVAIAKFFWTRAGAKLDGPGRGRWARVLEELDNADLGHRELAQMINDILAPPLPPNLRRNVLKAAKQAARLMKARR